jgi:hypothetical protein
MMSNTNILMWQPLIEIAILGHSKQDIDDSLEHAKVQKVFLNWLELHNCR